MEYQSFRETSLPITLPAQSVQQRHLTQRIHTIAHVLSQPVAQQIALLVLIVLLLLGSIVVSHQQAEVYAASASRISCTWYQIKRGDTLLGIAHRHHTTTSALVQANALRNANLIYAGRPLCIPQHPASSHRSCSSGLCPDGSVSWFAYHALQHSTRDQVAAQLRSAAARYGLPASLLLAIAWQESGWNQHIIARDGGIGVMQLMPETARGLNIMTRSRHNPYKLTGNIELGAIYLRTLWNNFHGDITKVISAYNQGGWNVVHKGIFNWPYVNNVKALMRRFK
ncbi:MAG: LysM peptidoglycan-binding domain-containing protein [Ktedonobacteraceae bacterium]|nr:LysM peptidoglycan-binding domain-containing protein [Ktedonobacteraceae bacterium]